MTELLEQQLPDNFLSGPNLSGAQKVVTLLLAMGKDSAKKITEHFSPDELQKLVNATKSLPGIDVETVDGVLREFGRYYEKSGLVSASDELMEILGLRQGTQNGSESNDEAEEGEQGEEKVEIEADAVREFFETEPVVMSAILLGALDDNLAGKALGQLEEKKRNDILGAFLTRQLLSEEQEENLKTEMLAIVANYGGSDEMSSEMQKAVSLMTYFDDEAVESILASISGDDPGIAGQIRKSIFRFSQITELEEEAIAILVDRLETDDITACLTGANSAIVEAILKPLSQRNRRVVEAELSRNAIGEEMADTARKKVASIAIALAKEGKLALPQQG